MVQRTSVLPRHLRLPCQLSRVCASRRRRRPLRAALRRRLRRRGRPPPPERYADVAATISSHPIRRPAMPVATAACRARSPATGYARPAGAVSMPSSPATTCVLVKARRPSGRLFDLTHRPLHRRGGRRASRSSGAVRSLRRRSAAALGAAVLARAKLPALSCRRGAALRRLYDGGEELATRLRGLRMELVSLAKNPVPSGGTVGIVSTATTEPSCAMRAGRRRAMPRRGTVCLFGGRAEFIEKYFEVIADLRRRGFAVATMDWRGQGGSQPHAVQPAQGPRARLLRSTTATSSAS